MFFFWRYIKLKGLTEDGTLNRKNMVHYLHIHMVTGQVVLLIQPAMRVMYSEEYGTLFTHTYGNRAGSVVDTTCNEGYVQ